jgi:phage-related protein
MANYPSTIQLPSGCGEVTPDPAIRTEFESGIVQTRARFTRMRRQWRLSWAYMRGADYRALRVFFEQMRGGTLNFNWTHPAENLVFNVRFKGEIQADEQSYDFWSVTVSLEQV